MINMMIFHDRYNGLKIMANTEEISSMEEADGDTTVVTLKGGKAWRVRESMQEITNTLSKLVEE
jgi:uncharacterized protein YlzI (FlbEa/FlbD family)